MPDSNEYEEVLEFLNDLSTDLEHNYIVGDKEDWERHVWPKYGQDLKSIELVDNILKESIINKVDKIYFECFKEKAIYRYENKGILSSENLLEKYQPIIFRLKLIFGLDVVEDRLPQRYEPYYLRIKNSNHLCKAYILTLPTVFGENAIIHIDYGIELTEIDIPKETQNLIKDYLNRKSGLIVTAGQYIKIINHIYYFLMNLIADSDLRIISIDENNKDNDLQKVANVSHVSHLPNIFSWPITLHAALGFSPDIIMINNVNPKNLDVLIDAVIHEPNVLFIISMESVFLNKLIKKCRTFGIDIERFIKDPHDFHPLNNLYTLFFKLPIEI